MGRPNLNYWHSDALYDETLSDSSLARTSDHECDVVAIRAVRLTKLHIARVNARRFSFQAMLLGPERFAFRARSDNQAFDY
jgi:hypothetical protein